jgi:hypothetical protein
MDIESKQNLISTGSIIVLATIGSFVASSAYVLGLSIGLHQPVYEFFELKDYLQVTPVWLLPTSIYLLFWGSASLFLPPLITISYEGDKQSNWKEKVGFVIFFLLPLPFLLVLHFLGVVVDNDFAGFVVTMHLVVLLGLSVAFLIVYEKRLVGLDAKEKGLRIVLVTNITALFIALYVGYSWPHQWAKFSKESTVLFGDSKSDTKDQVIRGKILLQLEKYLLLQDESDHFVAISTSQIKRIDIPPPSPTPSPTPDPDSVN